MELPDVEVVAAKVAEQLAALAENEGESAPLYDEMPDEDQGTLRELIRIIYGAIQAVAGEADTARRNADTDRFAPGDYAVDHLSTPLEERA